ncbi:MAG: hypothetical protein WCL00_09850, partial [Bacteroidota bacterium]
KKKEKDSALVVYREAMLLRRLVTADHSTDSLAALITPVMDDILYHQYFSLAEEKIRYRNFREGYPLAEKSMEIALKSGRESDPVLDSLIRISYPVFLIERLALAESMIWSGQYKNALHFVDSIEQIQKKSSCRDHLQLRNSILKFRQKISTQQCRNLKDLFEALQIRAWRNIEMKKYIQALSLLDSAMLLKKKRVECTLHGASLEDSLKKYSPPAEYQSQQARIENSLALGEFGEVISMISFAGANFLKDKLAIFGLEKVELREVVEERRNQNFTIFTARYFLEAVNLKEAMDYLKLLKRQGGKETEAAGLMKSLGQKLAEADYRNAISSVPQQNLLKYQVEDDWFVEFRKNYIKTWKRETTKVENEK